MVVLKRNFYYKIICSRSEAALRALRMSIVTLKQAMRALSGWSSVAVLWVPGYSGIQGKEVAQIPRLGRDRVGGKL
jgi:hypothetical protein